MGEEIFSLQDYSMSELVTKSMAENQYSFIFKSVESILDLFKQHQDRKECVELMTIYNKAKENAATNQNLSSKKYPFIVLEGLDASGKSTLSRKLSEVRKAKLLRTPPEILSDYRSLFDQDFSLRTAFYCLSNYIAAEEIKVLLQHSPVVLDRFWHSTATYALAQAVHDNKDGSLILPPENHGFYYWPEDLLKPDIVMYLDVSEQERLKRIARRKTVTEQESLLESNIEFRRDILKAYERMKDPGVIKINSNLSIKNSVAQLIENTNYLFI